MLVKTEGLILKTTKYRETSIIVKAYTLSHGVLSFIVKGVRTSKKTNIAVLFQPLNFLDLIIYYKENKGLLHLKEYKFNYLYQDIPFNILKSSVAILILEVIEHALFDEEENEVLYEFIKNTFLSLDIENGNISNFHLKFLNKFMFYKGIQAQGKYSENTPYFNMAEGIFTKEFSHGLIDGLLAENFSKLLHETTLTLNKKSRKELLKMLLLYFEIHIEGFRKIKSIDVFEDILE